MTSCAAPTLHLLHEAAAPGQRALARVLQGDASRGGAGARELSLPLTCRGRRQPRRRPLPPRRCSGTSARCSASTAPVTKLQRVRREPGASLWHTGRGLRAPCWPRRPRAGLTRRAPPADVLSAVEFDSTGEQLATGDRGGRVVLFERVDSRADAVRAASAVQTVSGSQRSCGLADACERKPSQRCSLASRSSSFPDAIPARVQLCARADGC